MSCALLVAAVLVTGLPGLANNFEPPAEIQFLVEELDVLEAMTEKLNQRIAEIDEEIEAMSPEKRKIFLETIKKEIAPREQEAEKIRSKIVDWVRDNVHRVQKERREAPFPPEALPAVRAHITKREQRLPLLEEAHRQAIASGESQPTLDAMRERIAIEKSQLSAELRKYRESLERASAKQQD